MYRKTKIWITTMLLIGLELFSFSYAITEGENEAYAHIDEMFELASDYRDNALYQSSSYEDGIMICDKGIAHFESLETDYPAALSLLYQTRADIYISMKKYEEAISDCKKGMDLHPKFMGLRISLGKAYTGLGEADPQYYQEALKIYTENLELDPGNDFMLLYRAEVYNLLGQNDKAMVDIDSSINLSGGYWKGYYIKAKILLSEGKYEEAVDVADYALTLDNFDQEPMISVGEPLLLLKEQLDSMMK